MADEDRENDGPSLELPSLSIGRRRKKSARETRKAARRAERPEAAAGETSASDTTQWLEALREPEAARPPAPAVPDEAPTAVAPPVVAEPEPHGYEERPLYADETAPLAPPAPEPAADAGNRQSGSRRSPRSPRTGPRLPALGGMTASVLTGLLVGALAVGLTWASLRGCEYARGTSSCGGGPGFLLLVAILVALVLLGAGLLRAFRVKDPASTSFLAVGLLAVVVLLVLVDVLENWWIALVVPAITVVTFALSHWVTTTFIEPAER